VLIGASGIGPPFHGSHSVALLRVEHQGWVESSHRAHYAPANGGVRMRRTVNGSRVIRTAFSGIATLLVVYLALLALWPKLSDSLPAALSWFGRPASAPTIGITLLVLTVACALNFQAPGLDLKGVPVKVIAGLIATTLVLGLSAYGPCHDEKHPAFFSALASTFSLFRGFIRQDVHTGGGVCPMPTPVALEVARLSALATIFVGVVGAAVVLFRAQADRLRAGLARSVTAVVGLDDATASTGHAAFGVHPVARHHQPDQRPTHAKGVPLRRSARSQPSPHRGLRRQTADGQRRTRRAGRRRGRAGKPAAAMGRTGRLAT
jgi:hypothetical protein